MNIAKLVVKFPFSISQVADNAVEIQLSPHGLQFPGLRVAPAEADKFNAAAGITQDEHEAVLDQLQHVYIRKLIVAAIKVEGQL